MGRLEGRVAFVTGGARGMGRNHCLALAREGASVAIFDLGDGHRDAEPGYPLARQAELDASVDGVRKLGHPAIGLAGDVRNQKDLDEAVAKTVAEFGRIDILVANAGIAMMGPAWEMSRAEWDLLIGTNLTGVWQSCKAAIPQMIEQQYGRIILISSATGYKAFDQLGPYCAAKAGVIALGKVMALELAKHWITVNSICPGTVDSGASRGLAFRHHLDWDNMLKTSFLPAQVVPDLLTMDDISNGVVFLASDEARYLTGVALPIDAGVTAK